jgi:hypothetical protein
MAGKLWWQAGLDPKSVQALVNDARQAGNAAASAMGQSGKAAEMTLGQWRAARAESIKYKSSVDEAKRAVELARAETIRSVGAQKTATEAQRTATEATKQQTAAQRLAAETAKAQATAMGTQISSQRFATAQANTATAQTNQQTAAIRQQIASTQSQNAIIAQNIAVNRSQTSAFQTQRAMLSANTAQYQQNAAAARVVTAQYQQHAAASRVVTAAQQAQAAATRANTAQLQNQAAALRLQAQQARATATGTQSLVPLTNQLNQALGAVGITLGAAGLVMGGKQYINFLNDSDLDSVRAANSIKIFNREIELSGNSSVAGAGMLRRLADEFNTTEDAVAKGAVTLLRMGATTEQVELLLQRGGASALAFGRSAADGFESIGQAIQGQSSQMLNYIGIAGNISTENRRLAEQLGKVSDELTSQEQVQSAVNLVLRETNQEYAMLPTLLSGLVGQQQEFNVELTYLRRELGDGVTPALADMYSAGSDLFAMISEHKQTIIDISDLFLNSLTHGINEATASLDYFLGIWGKLASKEITLTAVLKSEGEAALRGLFGLAGTGELPEHLKGSGDGLLDGFDLLPYTGEGGYTPPTPTPPPSGGGSSAPTPTPTAGVGTGSSRSKRRELTPLEKIRQDIEEQIASYRSDLSNLSTQVQWGTMSSGEASQEKEKLSRTFGDFMAAHIEYLIGDEVRMMNDAYALAKQKTFENMNLGGKSVSQSPYAGGSAIPFGGSYGGGLALGNTPQQGYEQAVAMGMGRFFDYGYSPTSTYFNARPSQGSYGFDPTSFATVPQSYYTANNYLANAYGTGGVNPAVSQTFARQNRYTNWDSQKFAARDNALGFLTGETQGTTRAQMQAWQQANQNFWLNGPQIPNPNAFATVGNSDYLQTVLGARTNSAYNASTYGANYVMNPNRPSQFQAQQNLVELRNRQPGATPGQSYDRVSGNAINLTEVQEQIAGAARDAAEQQRLAADQFYMTIVDAAGQAGNTLLDIVSGKATGGSAIAGLGGAAGSIVGAVNPLIGTIISVGTGLLGGLFDILFPQKKQEPALSAESKYQMELRAKYGETYDQKNQFSLPTATASSFSAPAWLDEAGGMFLESAKINMQASNNFLKASKQQIGSIVEQP